MSPRTGASAVVGGAVPFVADGDVGTSPIRALPDVRVARERYESCVPFRHVIVDNFFNADFANRLHERMPRLRKLGHTVAAVLGARSYATAGRRYDPAFAEAFGALAESRIASWLQEVTSIASLRLDDANIGAGIHQGVNGSALPVHADHNTHADDASQYRRINVMVYLNPHWRAAWGGHLELYDRSGSYSVDRIEPRFNRAVILEVHDTAFHGYRRLKMPVGQARQALAAYYYSGEPAPLQGREPHATIFAFPKDISMRESVLIRLRRAVLHRVVPRIDGLRLLEK